MSSTVLHLDSVVKHFPDRPHKSAPWMRKGTQVKAVNGVNLELARGETLGLVGESGCGKSTLARCITRLYPLTSGRVLFDDRDITTMSIHELREVRQDLQMIFQDPYSSLNPRRRVGSMIADVLTIRGIGSRSERKRRVKEVMELVGLSPEHYNRYPGDFSGGQRQRIGIARAIISGPKVVVCDEPVSALDVSIQAQILNLLMRLQRELGLSYVFITHDLSVVRHISDRIAVMREGRIIETASAEDLCSNPKHPYTRELLAASPKLEVDHGSVETQVLGGS